jgi:hypothetical protein
MRRRRKPERAAAHHDVMSLGLQFRRRVRPAAVEARSDIADARLVPPARAAPAEVPDRQRFAIEASDRGERGVALRRLLVGRQALVEQAASFGFFCVVSSWSDSVNLRTRRTPPVQGIILRHHRRKNIVLRHHRA